MPLQKSTLETSLRSIFEQHPDSAAAAAQDWARAYVGYAGAALSAATSLPTNAQALLGALAGAWTPAFESRAAAAAAGAMAQGVTVFWQSIVWAGATAAGATVAPGNFTLQPGLLALFSDLSETSAADKARQFADLFDAGARQVIVSDVPYVQPAPPIVGPIQ